MASRAGQRGADGEHRRCEPGEGHVRSTLGARPSTRRASCVNLSPQARRSKVQSYAGGMNTWLIA
jgi:hypothetical protein